MGVSPVRCWRRRSRSSAAWSRSCASWVDPYRLTAVRRLVDGIPTPTATDREAIAARTGRSPVPDVGQLPAPAFRSPRAGARTTTRAATWISTITALLFPFLLPPPAFCQKFVAEASLAHVPSVRVTSFLTLENADRDCLRDPRVLETEAELVFRRSGVSVADRSPFKFAIDIVALRTDSGLCVAAYAFQLVAGVPELGMQNLQLYHNMGVMSGPHYSFQDRLRNATNEAASDLANEILRAKAK